MNTILCVTNTAFIFYQWMCIVTDLSL